MEEVKLLSEAARIITEVSGHKITGSLLRSYIKKGVYKYPVKRYLNGWLLESKGIYAFAHTFEGIVLGRPKKDNDTKKKLPQKEKNKSRSKK